MKMATGDIIDMCDVVRVGADDLRVGDFVLTIVDARVPVLPQGAGSEAIVSHLAHVFRSVSRVGEWGDPAPHHVAVDPSHINANNRYVSFAEGGGRYIQRDTGILIVRPRG
ncbi:hypothetical protein [Luteitalea sp.]|uniref:hypothetical protein n=1 Tax=Luteitalea sp. TaxID=2004800 RepID=UPI0025BBAEC5|nr:hypothetical protein [Luteitalea sp.]